MPSSERNQPTNFRERSTALHALSVIIGDMELKDAEPTAAQHAILRVLEDASVLVDYCVFGDVVELSSEARQPEH
jgi:hypothetical protein